MPITEKPLDPDKGWADLHAPELIKWEKPGELVIGVLQSITAVVLSQKRVAQYLVQLDQKQMKFLGTYDITQKLTSAHIGCQVRVKYLGEDENIRGGPTNQPMKVFSIQIKGTPRAVAGGPITDDDVPF